MKLNRKWLLLVALVLSVAMATTGTLAYLTDEDKDINTMTLGKVEIVQNEQEWNSDGTMLVPFTQDKPMLPVVGTDAYNDFGNAPEIRRLTMKNVVDKYVSVTNTGKSNAYVRTLIALEMGSVEFSDLGNLVGASVNMVDGDQFDFPGAWLWPIDDEFVIDGLKYNVMVAVHENPVAPSVTTIPSLLQVYLKSAAKNEDLEALDGNKNGKYDILVLSQAVQADGFETMGAAKALDEAFGTVDQTNVAEWFKGWVNWEEEGKVGSPNTDPETGKNDTNNPPTLAVVTQMDPASAGNEIMTIALDDGYRAVENQPEQLDCYYIFRAAETAEEAKAGPYADWEADYVVSFDKPVLAGTGGLAGQYDVWSPDWLGLVLSKTDIPANEKLRLLTSVGDPWTYPDICESVKVFRCGAFDYDDALAGTTMTVQLCLFEPGNAGNPLVVGEFKHTFTTNGNNKTN